MYMSLYLDKSVIYQDRTRNFTEKLWRQNIESP